MAIALVKLGAVATSTTASVTPSFGQATTAGNLLVACVETNSGDPQTSSTGWTLAGSSTATVGLFYKLNCGAGETAPTFTASGSPEMEAVLGEFSGAATSGTPQGANTQISQSLGTGTAQVNSADGATGYLCLAAVGYVYLHNGNPTLTNSFNNATAVDISNNGGARRNDFYDFFYGITTANASADSATATTSVTSTLELASELVLAVFAPAAAAAVYPPRIRTVEFAVKRAGNY